MADLDQVWHGMAKRMSVSSNMAVYGRIGPSMDAYGPICLIVAYYDPI